MQHVCLFNALFVILFAKLLEFYTKERKNFLLQKVNLIITTQSVKGMKEYKRKLKVNRHFKDIKREMLQKEVGVI